MKKRLVMAGAIVVVLAGLLGYVGYTTFIPPKDSPTDSKQKKASSVKTEGEDGDDVSEDGQSTSEAGGAARSEYENGRFGFRISYPSDWSKTVSQNGDGATFAPAGQPNVAIRAYGYVAGMQSLDEMLATQQSYIGQSHVDLAVVSKTETMVDEHPALEAVWSYTAIAGDAPSTGQQKKRLVISRKDEAGIVLEMSGDASAVDDLGDEFSRLTEGFRLQ